MFARFSSTVGDGEIVRAHLQRVNNWSEAETRRHIETARATCRRLSRTTWTLDLSILAATGLQPLSGTEFAPPSLPLPPPRVTSDLPEPIWRPRT